MAKTMGEEYPRENAIPLNSLPEHATGKRVTVPGAPANGVFIDYGPGHLPAGATAVGESKDPRDQKDKKGH